MGGVVGGHWQEVQRWGLMSLRETPWAGKGHTEPRHGTHDCLTPGTQGHRGMGKEASGGQPGQGQGEPPQAPGLAKA